MARRKSPEKGPPVEVVPEEERPAEWEEKVLPKLWKLWEKLKIKKDASEVVKRLRDDREALRAAGLPEQEIKREDIEKPVESFADIQKRINKEVERTRTQAGKRLSPGESYIKERDLYLAELGYSTEIKGLLGGKARVLNERGEYIIDEKTNKPREFKTAWTPKGETEFLKFLKEELKNKVEGEEKEKEAMAGAYPDEFIARTAEGLSQPEGLKTEELAKAVEEMGKVSQPEVERLDKEQEKQEEKFSSLKSEMGKVGKERLEKWIGRAAFLLAPDILAKVAWDKTKSFAKKAGKTLLRIGLTPCVAIEKKINKIRGTVELVRAAVGEILTEAKAVTIDAMSDKEATLTAAEIGGDILKARREMSEKRKKAVQRMVKKGFLARLIEKLK